jgi:protein-disulfide isomerase
MTLDAKPDDRRLALAPLDKKVDPIEYGDYECPFSRQAFYAIQQVDRQVDGNMRFAYRHFPLTSIHPQALAAEAAALQNRFWDMHELMFHRQEALEDSDLLGYAARLGLDLAAFDHDRASTRWRSGSAGMWTAA